MKMALYTGSALSNAPMGPISGTRLLITGDSRVENGMVFPQSLVTAGGMTIGMVEAYRTQSTDAWMLRALGWPMYFAGGWAFGGSKTSETTHGHALEVKASRRPDLVSMTVGTNDPVDYTGSGGLGPIPLGDPAAPPESQPRVGHRAPVGAGIGQQGTTFGNLDKELTFWGDPVANGLGRAVPVWVREYPTENPGRRATNRAIVEWFRAWKAQGRWPHATLLGTYEAMLQDPAMIEGPVTSEVVRRDLVPNPDPVTYPDGYAGTVGDKNVFLHPSPDEAFFAGTQNAAEPAVIAAVAALPSLLHLPDGSNDADFINANPALREGAGNGTLGYSGSTSPAPTGTLAEGWSVGHNATDGSISVECFFNDDGDQVIRITRSGGSGTDLKFVELRGPAVGITPVAGDTYTVHSRVVAAAQTPQPLYTVFPHIFFSETGLVDLRGNNISTGTYGAFNANNPNRFPNEGADMDLLGVPLEITPSMVSSATGPIDLSARIQIGFVNNMSGVIEVVCASCGIKKDVVEEAYIAPPAVPSAGAACTVAPVISGSVLVGGTITLNDGTFASGSITSRRLLRDGVPVSFTGSSYALTEADDGKRFVFENTNTASGALTIAQSLAFGPISTPSAELAALIEALEGVENNAIFDFRQAVVLSGIWRAEDLSGNGNPALQSAGVRQPGISSTLGAVLDGSNDCMGFTWQTAAPSTVTVVLTMTKTAGDTGKRILSDGTNTNAAGQYQTASTALPGTWTVDGVSVATQGDLFNALEVPGPHTIMVTGLDVSTWPAIFFGRISSTPLASMEFGVVIDEATADLAATQTKTVTFVEAT